MVEQKLIWSATAAGYAPRKSCSGRAAGCGGVDPDRLPPIGW